MPNPSTYRRDTDPAEAGRRLARCYALILSWAPEGTGAERAEARAKALRRLRFFRIQRRAGLPLRHASAQGGCVLLLQPGRPARQIERIAA